MLIAAFVIVALLGWAATGRAWGAQADPGVPEGTRRDACAVPDPARRAPLTDGTDGDRGIVTASGATPEPELFALQADIDRVVRTLAACLSTGQHRIVAELATGRYLGALAGTGGVLTDDVYVVLAQDLPTVPVTIRSIENVRRDGANMASADVVYVVANQLVHGRWSFVQPVDPSIASSATPGAEAASDGGVWLIDAEQPLPVASPPGAARIAVELDEYVIDPERERVTPTEGDVVLAVRNAGEREHELLVLRLDGEADASDLLRAPGPRLPEGFVFVGQVTLPPGGQADLILVDLPAGRYALVSLLPDEDGTPGLERGMEAELRID